MSKYNNGDKFLIEIEDNVLMEHGVLYKIKGFNALVFDEYGLDKLEKVEMSEKPKRDIKVGEVVKKVDDGTKAIVMDKNEKEELWVLTENGCIEMWSNESVYETNTMYDIKNVLASLRTF